MSEKRRSGLKRSGRRRSGLKRSGRGETASDLHRLGRIGIVGQGRAGLTLATALCQAGGGSVISICRDPIRRKQIEAWIVHGRSSGELPTEENSPWAILPEPDAFCRQIDTVIFATADRDLSAAAQGWQEAGATSAGQTWLHLSGLLSPEVLKVEGGAEDLGSIHPLAALPDPLLRPTLSDGRPPIAATVAPLHGALFALTGTETATALGRALCRRLRGEAITVPLDNRGAWHGAAALVANDLVALLITGEMLTAQAGVPTTIARRGLLHLSRTALDALTPMAERPDESLALGLTGAVGRGDTETLLAHLETLRHSPDGRAAHAALSRVLLSAIGEAELISAPAAAAMLRALSDERS